MAIKKVKLPDNTTVELNDARVDVSSPSNGQVLAYNSTSQKFENQSISTGGGDVYYGDGVGGGEAATILSGVTFNGTPAIVTDGVAAITATIPDAVTESTVSGWGFTKNTGTITGITMNGSSKGTSGVVDLGTVIVSETQLSKGNTSGSGNAVTDISVSNHQITLTKGSTFLTSHQSIKTVNNTTMTGTGNVSVQETLVSGTNIKTINNESILGSGNLSVSGLPSVSSSDNGKVLEVSSGAWAAVKPVTIYSGSSAPSSGTGSDGDIYIQTES